MSWNFTKARSPVERKPVVTVWPPPSVPIFRSMSTDGSCLSLVLNGPEALIRTGLSSPGLPLSWTEASSFRSALLIDELNALSSRSWTFSLSSPPPHEARARVANSRTGSRRRTRRRLAGPPQLDATSDVGQPDGVREANRRGRRCRGARSRGAGSGRTGDRGGRGSHAARGGSRRADQGGDRPRDADRGERVARSRPRVHEERQAGGLRRSTEGAPPQAHQPILLPALALDLRAFGPHAQEARRRPRGSAALRAHLGGVARPSAAAWRNPHAGGVPPARAQPPVLAPQAVPGDG